MIDGRQPGYSEGATLYEAAQWLLKMGAVEGINLDGVGSSTMAMEKEAKARLLNRPSCGSQRLVGNSLGIGLR